MNHTEEEARTKWCPHVASKCDASDCMMWRWAQKPNQDWKPNSSMTWPARDTRSDPPMYVDDTTRGHCGLAGRV
jgi:hypothetical protein